MKVLVITAETQGRKPEDCCAAEEGELAVFCHMNLPEAMVGAKSRKASTTVTVAELPNLTMGNLISEVWDGRMSRLSNARQLAEQILRIASKHPVGTILEKDGADFRVRLPEWQYQAQAQALAEAPKGYLEGAMRFSLDGGVTWLDAPHGLLVNIEDALIPREDERGLVSLNFTSEGLIKDIWVSREETLDHNIATSSVLYEDLVSAMIEADR